MRPEAAQLFPPFCIFYLDTIQTRDVYSMYVVSIYTRVHWTCTRTVPSTVNVYTFIYKFKYTDDVGWQNCLQIYDDYDDLWWHAFCKQNISQFADVFHLCMQISLHALIFTFKYRLSKTCWHAGNFTSKTQSACAVSLCLKSWVSGTFLSAIYVLNPQAAYMCDFVRF